MEQHHRSLINHNLSDLITCTTNVEAIVNDLLEKNIINRWMKGHILLPKEDAEQKRNLYKLIQGRGPHAFSALCETLEDTSNIKARDIMLSLKPSIETLNNPYVKIHPQRRRMDVDNDQIKAYPMGSNPKGHALILNISKVIHKEERTGSNVDSASLMKLFNGFGYVTELKVDSTAKELKEILKQFIENCDRIKTNSIVVFIMSYGIPRDNSFITSDILTADGIRFNTKWLVKQFEPYQSLSKIPKMFFIQVSIKGIRDRRWEWIENPKVQNDSTTIDSSVEPIVGLLTDNVFIANFTVSGYNTELDPINSSYFIQQFCEVFREYAWELELYLLMHKLHTVLRELNNEENGYQINEWKYIGFNKSLFFNPGLYDDNSDQ